MANKNPSPGTRFAPGRSGNPGGRAKRPTIAALDALIERVDADRSLADVWLKEAIGIKETVVEKTGRDGQVTRTVTREQVPASYPFFKLLLAYRNGKPGDLPDAEVQDIPPRIAIPRTDDRPGKPKAHARRRKAQDGV